MTKLFEIFFKAEGTRPWLVLICLLLGGLLEAVGIGSLLPLITSLQAQGGPPTRFEDVFHRIFSALGMESGFGTLIIVIVAIMVLRAVMLYVAMTYAGINSARVSNNIRKRLIKALFDARWSYYVNQSSGRLASTISNDATRAGDAYYTSAVTIAMSIQILAYSAIALLINWRVAVLAVAAALFMAALSSRVVSISKRAGYKQIDRTAALTSDMVDLVHNLKSLKAMHRYDPMIVGLTDLARRLKRALYTQNLAKFALHYGNDALMAIFVGAAAWFAVVRAGIPIQELLVLGALFIQVIAYATKLVKQFQAAKQVEAAYVRAEEMIADAAQQKEIRVGTQVPARQSDIVFDRVSFSHGAKPVLRNVSLTVPRGQITVLQGRSGAGKTTLVDLLIGFHRPDSGRITVGGTSIADVDLALWRQMIGYVPQELTLFHDTVRENITLSETDITDEDIQFALRLAGAAEFVAALQSGMDTDVGEFGNRFSGGQRQRIALARALVRKPDVLVLDEVTSALDPENENAIIENIARLKDGFTIIAITHRPAWTRIADKLYQFDGGKVSEVVQHKTRRRPMKALAQ